MASEATLLGDSGEVKFTAAAALTAGEVLQLPDGRAAVVGGLAGFASGDPAMAYTKGRYTLAKTASINILDGGRVYWDRSAGTATFTPASGDFFIGVAVGDSLAAATTVVVDLNVKQENLIDFDGNVSECLWTVGITGAAPPTLTEATLAAKTVLAFTTDAQAQMVSMLPTNAAFHAPIADGPILEMKIDIAANADAVAGDYNFGLANGGHASDFDSVTEAVVFHIDGHATEKKILAESDDGTTEVNATDTTVVFVEGTEQEFWIDARDPTDVQIYIDGVNVLAASVFKLDAATGPIFPVVHIEKSSDATGGSVKVAFIKMRTTDLS